MDCDSSPRRAAQYKSRNPGWKDSLKNRCRLEMRVRRQSVLNRMRNMSIDDDALLEEILYTELQTLKKQLGFSESDDFSFKEDVDEIKQELLIEQANQDMGFHLFDELASSQFQCLVICPMCQKNNLTETSRGLSCPCGLHLSGKQLSLSQVESALSTASELHSSSCDAVPLFSVESDGDCSVLSMQCINCSFFYRIV